MPTIRVHWDADGIVSGHFASLAIPNSELKVGVYEKGFGDTSGLTSEDWMLDIAHDVLDRYVRLGKIDNYYLEPANTGGLMYDGSDMGI